MVRATALALTLALTLGASPRPLELADLRASVGIVAPQIAPDGKHIAVVLRRGDYTKNRMLTELVLVDTQTRSEVPLTRGRSGVGDVRWSPDGTRLAFVAMVNDPKAKAKPTRQLFTIAFDGSEPLQVTAAPNGVGDYAWRPDGGAFAYTTADDAANKKAIEAHDDAFAISTAAWTEDAASVSDHIWTIAASAGKATRVTSGDWTVAGSLAFSRDGGTLFFARKLHPDNHYRDVSIVAIDLHSHMLRSIAPPLRRASDAIVSPDGAHIAFTIERPGAPTQSDIGLSDLHGGRFTDLTTSLDRNVGSIVFAADGKSVYTAANDAARSRIYRVGIDGTARALPLGDLNVRGTPSVARDGTVAFVAGDGMHAAELYVAGGRAHRLERLTALNTAIDTHILAPTHAITWRTRDGFIADGVLTQPVGYVHGKKYPLVLVIHGGPTATSVTNYDSLSQLLAAHGFFVFQPNYRGSDNLGHAWSQATVPHITSAPAQDCEEGLAAVLKTGDIDPARIGVSGWSEGGLMTSWLIGHDTRWKAAMTGAAVNDWVQYGDLTDSKDFTPIFIGASPWSSARERAFYKDESPLSYADRVRTPTLMMTDSGDQRVPTPLDYEFYHAVRATGTPVELYVFPRGGHYPTDPVGQEAVTRRWVGWFADRL